MRLVVPREDPHLLGGVGGRLERLGHQPRLRADRLDVRVLRLACSSCGSGLSHSTLGLNVTGVDPPVSDVAGTVIIASWSPSTCTGAAYARAGPS